MDDKSPAGHSSIQLPIDAIEKCDVCGKKGQLKLCARCFDAVYCSTECQNKDWKDGHKKWCVKVKRIDLEQIYPFLAGVSCLCRTTPSSPRHPANLHRITNEPNPDTPAAIQLIPGSNEYGVIVGLGDPISMQESAGPIWWPKALSGKVRRKLWRRISWEGWAFHTHYATAFALLDQFYAQGEFRLKYKTSPIVDFGIAHGKWRLTDGDRLAYILSDGTVKRGPDPMDHWWIWFKTARGEELTLDFGAYTWNLCMMVKVDTHIKGTPLDMAPATFRNRGLAGAPSIYEEDRRLTVLRDPELGHLATDHPDVLPVGGLIDWAERYALWRKVTDEEKRFMPEWLAFTTQWVQKALDSGDWKTWPAEPLLGMDLDPSEEVAHDARGL